MGSKLLSIQSVAGAGPSYTLTVIDSTGVVTADHVVAPLLSDNTHGGIYRVTGVPTGTSINIQDDLVPGGGTYGAPTSGPGASWTPSASGFSDSKANNTPFWGDIIERDHLLLDAAAIRPPGFDAICGAGDTVGSGVYVSGSLVGGVPTVSTVDITDPAKMPAIGVIVSKASSTTCFVQFLDLVESLPFTFSTGSRVFFTNSGLSNTIPSSSGDFVQLAGIAADTDALMIGIGPPIRRA
jgi:hypothetical protein